MAPNPYWGLGVGRGRAGLAAGGRPYGSRAHPCRPLAGAVVTHVKLLPDRDSSLQVAGARTRHQLGTSRSCHWDEASSTFPLQLRDPCTLEGVWPGVVGRAAVCRSLYVPARLVHPLAHLPSAM